jgi:hypothetical protein
MLNIPGAFHPRKTVLENWTWPHSIQKLQNIIDET